ncbi:PREDICTED: uncharacterized protein LOC109339068 [Lupinus angustifolius]|uniref:uncharacterized protein LOC109339068 n=1 Tax=Lupinus angustifolius TaxID=3871 RepID=UPI00092EED62|nr:PREDICTED: uncharacterized protein LOC109339068 [Lupinus angustifolius]
MAQTTGNYVITLPVLDGKNWSRWCIQMKAILGYQDVADIVEEGLPTLEEGATEAQRNIVGSATAKEAWDVLENHYAGATQLKKFRLQTLRRQYQLMQMEKGEGIAKFFTRLITHINAMKACGEKMEDTIIVEKVLRSVTPRFDNVVIAIEESGRVENMKVEELQGSLEAHEQRLNDRITGQSSHQALQCLAPSKNQNQRRQDSEAHLAKEEINESDEEVVQFMMTTDCTTRRSDTWYLDSGCSNHMTGHKEWLVHFDPSKGSKVKFADNRVAITEGMGDIPLKLENGKRAYITDVLLVPEMRTNLISLGQLHEKGFTMRLNNGVMEVLDNMKRRILQAPLSNNRTFQI